MGVCLHIRAGALLVAAALVAVCVGTSCASAPTPTGDARSTPAATPAHAPPALKADAGGDGDASVTEADASAEAPALPAVPASLADSINLFAGELHGQLPKNGNLFYSPISISIALTMTHAAARGQTADEMTRVLHLGSNGQRAHAAYAKLMTSLASVPKAGAPEIRIANRLWLDQRAEPQPEFTSLTEEHYRARVQILDILDQPEPSRLVINRWVEKQTKDRVKDLIPRDGIEPETRAVLTNAIYFKGLWAEPFDKGVTRDQPFYDGGTTKRNVAMMHAKVNAPYAETTDAQVLQLPYSRGGGPALAMVIVLPKQRGGLAAIEKRYASAGLDAFVRDLLTTPVSIDLPRFTATVEYKLKPVLTRLGMPTAFSNRAEFPGMLVSESLKIGEVFHKGFIRVDEEGTEAAAATAGTMVLVSEGPPRREFRAIHPFLFMIRDLKSGAILFAGRVVAP